VHPLVFDDVGNGIQAGLAGETFLYPANAFTTGFIGGRPVGCLTVAQQIAWHSGYDLRDHDWADLGHLHELDRDMNPRYSWGLEL
jgi:lincosamide nucleotidyltransferase A/C/D/E